MKAIRAAFATTGDDCRRRGPAGRRAVTSGGCGQPPFLDLHAAIREMASSDARAG